MSRVETGVATIYDFLETLHEAISESRRANNFRPLFNIEPLSLPAELEAEDSE